MKVGSIIFSRISSNRLPGKALIDISGKTLLSRVIERAKKIKSIDHICVATSVNSEDDIIEKVSKLHGVDVFRGDLNDVTQRAIDAARCFRYTSFLRLCADRPFFDGNIYDDLIFNHKKNKHDLTTNIFPRSVPPGLTGEVVSLEALEKCILMTEDIFDREHVTRFIYNNPSKFSIQNIKYFNDKDIIDLRLVVDNEVDLKRAIWIAEKIGKAKGDFPTKEIIQLAKKWKTENKISLNNKL